MPSGDEADPQRQGDAPSGSSLPPSGDPGYAPGPSLRYHGPGDPGPSLYPTPDAERFGLDRSTPQGAELAFVSSLRGTRRSHRVIAWVILMVMFGIPLLIAVIQSFSGN